MSRYDGLIIPRSYSEYINKTDAATLQQALQLSGVLSGTVAAGDNKAVKSAAVNNAVKIYNVAHTFRMLVDTTGYPSLIDILYDSRVENVNNIYEIQFKLKVLDDIATKWYVPYFNIIGAGIPANYRGIGFILVDGQYYKVASESSSNVVIYKSDGTRMNDSNALLGKFICGFITWYQPPVTAISSAPETKNQPSEETQEEK